MVQEHLRRGAFTLFKVRGDSNPADLCTKHLDRTTASYLLDLAGITFEDGRAHSAPQVSAEVEVLPLKAVRRLRAHEGKLVTRHACVLV